MFRPTCLECPFVWFEGLVRRRGRRGEEGGGGGEEEGEKLLGTHTIWVWTVFLLLRDDQSRLPLSGVVTDNCESLDRVGTL